MGGGVEVVSAVQEGLDHTLRGRELRDQEERVRELGAGHSFDGGRPHMLPTQSRPLGLGDSSQELVTATLDNRSEGDSRQ